jgi:hypothetical protein
MGIACVSRMLGIAEEDNLSGDFPVAVLVVDLHGRASGSPDEDETPCRAGNNSMKACQDSVEEY